MRLLRNLISNFTRTAPKRDFAHVHDVQIKWERTPVQNGKKQQEGEAGSMSLNGMYMIPSSIRGAVCQARALDNRDAWGLNGYAMSAYCSFA
jgi:beta-xylosidase